MVDNDIAQDIFEIDRIVHEPARLLILGLFISCRACRFYFLVE